MARNRMYLYGKNPVHERLKQNPGSIRQIFLQDNFRAPHIIQLIKSHGIPFKQVAEKDLLRIKRADRLQGIIAEVKQYEYTSFDYLLKTGIVNRLSFIFLDSLNDPHNFGSIMRTAACFGNLALVIPEHGSVEVNETVMHVASGGENFVPVSRVTNLAQTLIKAKKAGYWTVGTIVMDGEDINKVTLPFPLCLVLGSEGRGVRYGIEKHLDMKVTLPMKGARLSLNVAMACAIFCHEIARQKSE